MTPGKKRIAKNNKGSAIIQTKGDDGAFYILLYSFIHIPAIHGRKPLRSLPHAECRFGLPR
jgi:hypothetical protein